MPKKLYTKKDIREANERLNKKATMFCGSLETQRKKREFISKLKELGRLRITKACEAVPITPSTYYSWYKGDEFFRKTMDELRGDAIDFAFDKAAEKVMEKVDDGNVPCILFLLGKSNRGRKYFADRSESSVVLEDRRAASLEKVKKVLEKKKK